MRPDRALLLALPLALLDAGCSSDECTDPGKPGCVVSSVEDRIETPDVSAATLRTAVSDNTTFAIDLYQQLRTSQGNLFYSPFSISEALAMTWAGARGETAKQMATTLRFTLGQDELHPAFDALDLALHSRGQGARGTDGGRFKLDLANALWGQTSYPFAAPFLDVLGQYYGAGMHVVDFRGAPDASRVLINDWVSGHTSHRITNLLPAGSVTPSTRLVLTNAVYFDAAWKTAFKPSATAPAQFTRDDGSRVQVQLMKSEQRLRYGTGSGYAAVALPYDGDQLSMVLILPPRGELEALEASLTTARLAAIVGGLAPKRVTVQLPRFKMTSSFELSGTLAKMGMPDAFSGAADFSGMGDADGLALSAVVHKAYVDVGESGTEAAAATGGVVTSLALSMPTSIRLDHPFVVLIRDDVTGTILFLGRVADPTA